MLGLYRFEIAECVYRPPKGVPGIWPGLMGPDGFAAIPTAALDPPHSAASPAVPALHGSGSPNRHAR